MHGDYVELHAKSFYSFGLGASHAHELLTQAAQYGYSCLGLTDTNLCGALDFARQANGLGIRPVTGGELVLSDGSRLTLLASTREGYANLSRLFTLANAADRREPRLDPRLLPDHAGGLVLLTGGRDGPLSNLLKEGRSAEARQMLYDCLDWFGAGCVYVELQHNFLQGDTARNRELVALAAKDRRSRCCEQRRELPRPGTLPAAARAGSRQPQHHHRPGASLHPSQPPLLPEATSRRWSASSLTAPRPCTTPVASPRCASSTSAPTWAMPCRMPMCPRVIRRTVTCNGSATRRP